MVKHICNKEAELQKIMDDVSYIRKALEGNGHQGLIDETHQNSKFRHEAKAQVGMIKWIMGSGVLLIIMNAIALIGG